MDPDEVEIRLREAERTADEVRLLASKIDAVEQQAENAAENARATRGELGQIRSELADFRKEVRAAHETGNELAQKTATAVASPKTWSDHFKDMGTVLVPVAVALISAWVAIKTGAVK